MNDLFAAVFAISFLVSLVFFILTAIAKIKRRYAGKKLRIALISLAVCVASFVAFGVTAPSGTQSSATANKTEKADSTQPQKEKETVSMESFKPKCDELMKELGNDYYDSWVSTGGYLVLEVSNNGLGEEVQKAIDGDKDLRDAWAKMRSAVVEDYNRLIEHAKSAGIEKPLLSYNVVDDTNTNNYLLTVQGGIVAYDAVEEAIASAVKNATMGEQNALKKANSYLDYTAFSYEGLIDQLEYEGFTSEEAKFGADNCGADWYEQALKKAYSYLDYTAFSYSGLIDQLEYEDFTTDQATYAADNCGADWNEQAVKKAKSYLDHTSFSKSGLIEQLEYEGFTTEQATYGAEQNGY